MNCKNCGAPVSIDVRSGHLICHYCHTQQWADSKPGSADGVVPTRETAGVFCPCCMDESELQLGLIDKVPIVFCPDCFGFQIDSQALRVVLQNRRSEYSGSDDRPVPVDPAELQAVRHCPTCRKPMETHPYYGPGNSVIDSCSRCKAVWLDRGELSRLVRAPGSR